ncbi:MAG: phosphotransferase, partial [Bdellovibrionota bacterium]
AKYPLSVARIQFINHGENTTFKVTDSKGRHFLCRIHRNGYHSKPALMEEIRWLAQLAKEDMNVPKPIRSRTGKLIERVFHPEVGFRECDVFHWVEGRFIDKSLEPKHLLEMGILLSGLQRVGKKFESKHRKYWNTEGLVGSKPKFGNIDQLQDVKPKQQAILTAARKQAYKNLKAFEKRSSDRTGLIHADLHFGNMLITTDGSIGAIDFDDCGVGFHLYDLAVPLVSLEHRLKALKRFKEYPRFKAALIEGYTREVPWRKDDDFILTNLIMARRLMMLGWLDSRKDNPRLKKYKQIAIAKALKHIENPRL